MFSSPAARQALIMDHYLHPRHRGPLESTPHQGFAKARNCADTVTIGLTFANEKVAWARFEGSGCAIFTAATDLLLTAIIGKTPSEINALLATYEAMLQTGVTDPELGEINVLSNVKRHLNRVECALVPTRALRAALSATPLPQKS